MSGGALNSGQGEAAPFPVPRLPQGLVRLLARLSRRIPAFPVRLGETVFSLRPDLGAVDAAPGKGGPPDGIGIRLEVAGEIWGIRVRGLLAETLPIPPEGLNPEDIPDELRPALWALALEPLLDQGSAALGQKLALADVETAQAEHSLAPDPAAGGEVFLLPFSVHDDAGRPAGAGSFLLPLSANTLSLLAAAGNALPRRAAADLSALPVSLSLCAGHERFPLGLLREAAPGDVLQFALPAALNPLTLEVNSRELWTATLADGVVTLKGALSRPDAKDAFMTATTPDTAPSGKPETPAAEGLSPTGLSAAEIDALEVRLTLELEERLITVGELAALAPGHTLETTASLDAPVTLKANGRAVGKGRLVEVGDRLGVMIVSLSLSVSDAARTKRQ